MLHAAELMSPYTKIFLIMLQQNVNQGLMPGCVNRGSQIVISRSISSVFFDM